MFATQAQATKTAGRIVVGLATSTERFSSQDFGSDKNDSLFSSQRIYYRVYEMGDNHWEFTSDLRNKYDSFDTLNKEQYMLDPKNEFQVRQLSVKMHNPNGDFSPTIGRFQIPEAGSVFVDGASLQYRISKNWYNGAFAGLNPKQYDKAYLRLNQNTSQAGAYFTYQPKIDSWNENIYFSTAYVDQKYYSQTERQFLFYNAIYQWSEGSRIISLAYLDFTPKTNVQTALVIYQQAFSKSLATEIGTLSIDSLEYLRRQNVLEKLTPSSYKEEHASLDWQLGQSQTLTLYASEGKRSIDSLNRQDFSVGLRFNNIFSKQWDSKIRYISRKNFTSKDTIAEASLGYFSNSFEVSIDADYAVQKNDDGTTTHPQNSELNLTSFISKKIFATLSLQQASDETVKILGSFLKIGYRFGNQDLPPIRDGAAPRSSL